MCEGNHGFLMRISVIKICDLHHMTDPNIWYCVSAASESMQSRGFEVFFAALSFKRPDGI